ncbi:hypothetical protein Ae201684P_000548 [Aphanomyces euteiches]|nr:hypothetical protein Ae201684P_000548 [Aphanomyces euteiches]
MTLTRYIVVASSTAWSAQIESERERMLARIHALRQKQCPDLESDELGETPRTMQPLSMSPPPRSVLRPLKLCRLVKTAQSS